MMAKRENRGSEEASSFIKEASACRGQYPESNLDELLKKGTEKYSAFSSEFAYNMFFRPPVLK
jgi:hypothetical protein